MTELQTCPNCNNVLEMHTKTLKIYCAVCGWSENKNGNNEEVPDYVG